MIQIHLALQEIFAKEIFVSSTLISCHWYFNRTNCQHRILKCPLGLQGLNPRSLGPLNIKCKVLFQEDLLGYLSIIWWKTTFCIAFTHVFSPCSCTCSYNTIMVILVWWYSAVTVFIVWRYGTVTVLLTWRYSTVTVLLVWRYSTVTVLLAGRYCTVT